jgi:hypothetical protein
MMNWREMLEKIQTDKAKPNRLPASISELMMILILQNAEILERQSPLFIVQMSENVTEEELDRVREALRDWHRDREPAVVSGMKVHADS